MEAMPMGAMRGLAKAYAQLAEMELLRPTS